MFFPNPKGERASSFSVTVTDPFAKSTSHYIEFDFPPRFLTIKAPRSKVNINDSKEKKLLVKRYTVLLVVSSYENINFKDRI